jgi:hypothetical protein
MARLPAMPGAIRNSGQWERLPGRLGAGPQAHAGAAAILAAIRRVTGTGLTAYGAARVRRDSRRRHPARRLRGAARRPARSEPVLMVIGYVKGVAWLRSSAGVVP